MNAVALNVSLAPRVRVARKAAAKPARAVSPAPPRHPTPPGFFTPGPLSYPEMTGALAPGRDPRAECLDRSNAGH